MRVKNENDMNQEEEYLKEMQYLQRFIAVFFINFLISFIF